MLKCVGTLNASAASQYCAMLLVSPGPALYIMAYSVSIVGVGEIFINTVRKCASLRGMRGRERERAVWIAGAQRLFSHGIAKSEKFGPFSSINSYARATHRFVLLLSDKSVYAAQQPGTAGAFYFHAARVCIWCTFAREFFGVDGRSTDIQFVL